MKSIEEAAGGKWNVKTQSGTEDTFDAVVLTMPVPQILALSGTVKEIISEYRMRTVVRS